MSRLIFFIFTISVFSLGLAQLKHPSFSIHPDFVKFSGQSVFSNVSGTSPQFNSLAEALNASENLILKIKEAQGMPSVVLSIAVKGKTIWEKAWGFSDLENEIPAKLSTKYRIASISKTFTSVLIGTLVDRGLIHYDDPLSKYLPSSDFPPKFWNGTLVNITISQLLDHTAGTHVTELSDFNTIVPGINCTQMIHKFKNENLHFSPGSNFSYSNYGYQLLGAVIESVTKKTYQQAMTEFFQQLGLNSSYVETSDLMLHDRARYYRFPNSSAIKENVPTPLFDEAFHVEGWWPSGGLMSTVGDLVKFGNRIVDTYMKRSNAVLSEKTLKEMWTERTQHFPSFFGHPTNEYGYGWLIAHVSPAVNPNLKYRRFYWHSGGLIGVSTFLVVYPEQQMVVAAMTNKGYVGNLDNMAIYTAESVYQFC